MTHIIVGTAGHIDHGKSALVRALTGIEPDRLAEEKRRGISIDLGFAHLDLGGGLRLGFIDVPGHERFVRNMLAGAGGIDLVLLVVAADESIKPQTREHFEICRLLGIRRGVVALTKSDLVDVELRELVRLEVEEYLAGSFLESAPVVAVSAVTGAGLDELRAALEQVAGEVVAKDQGGLLRLPVDRAFTMRGFGTVVTGTLVSGTVVREQEVETQPGGRRLRVRGVQVHGAEAARAVAGQRTALNVAGAEAGELGRGVALVEPGKLRATTIIDCTLELLSSARPLKHRAPVHFHAWTAETLAEVRLLGEDDRLEPGGRGAVRLLLRDPVLLVPGDRFIVRMFSPVVTIGGGIVVDIGPPERLRRLEAGHRVAELARANLADRIGLLVRESGAGMSLPDLVARTGLPATAIERAAAQGNLLGVQEPQRWFADRQWAGERMERIRRRVAEFHQANPLAPGIAKEEVRSRELGDAPAFLLDALIAASSAVASEGELLRLKEHRLRLRDDEEAALKRIEEAFARAGLAVPGVAEVLSGCGVEAGRARGLLQILLRRKQLVKVSEDFVYHPSALAALGEMLAAHRGERFGVGQFKDWTGVSRKYAIPLLEYLDRERITRREGDQRLVL